MGHQRLGKLPQSRKWRHVVELISGGADVRDVAAAVSAAPERSMIDAADDPAVLAAFYLLTQIPLAARKEHFVSEFRALGLRLSDRPSLVEIVSALADAVDRQVRSDPRGRSGRASRRTGARDRLDAHRLPGLSSASPHARRDQTLLDRLNDMMDGAEGHGFLAGR
jgi:hypothetical protein